MDWVKVYESHTPDEWVHQVAVSIVDPWGDDRADLRAAVNTYLSLPLTQDDDKEGIFQSLLNYLGRESDDDTEIYNEDALKNLRGKINGR